jgi:hypothetical protein
MKRFLLHLWNPTLHSIELIGDHVTLARNKLTIRVIEILHQYYQYKSAL